MRALVVVSWSVRLLLLAAAIGLVFCGPIPVQASRIFPSLSPLAMVASAIAGHAWLAGLWWSLIPLAVFATAVWRGRFFCRHICPAGTAYSLAGKIGAQKVIFPWRFNGIIFWIIVLGGIMGAPLLLPLDPLALFNQTWTPIITRDIPAWISGALLPLFLLLSVIQPRIWCIKFCPLGYAYDLSHRLRHPLRVHPHDPVRRDIIVGLSIALPAAFVARRFGIPREQGSRLIPVLPPGAGTVTRFAGSCTRCYACVQKCPSSVIRVGTPHWHDAGALFLPHLDMNKGFCSEFCNDCTQACPVGALAPLGIDDKRFTQIGTAFLNQTACLAWTEGEHCMVCQEFCPYQAISNSPSPKGIPRPVVHPDLCRGCGACQKECPSVRAGKAIVVHGVETQQRLAQKPDLPSGSAS